MCSICVRIVTTIQASQAGRGEAPAAEAKRIMSNLGVQGCGVLVFEDVVFDNDNRFDIDVTIKTIYIYIYIYIL